MDHKVKMFKQALSENPEMQTEMLKNLPKVLNDFDLSVAEFEAAALAGDISENAKIMMEAKQSDPEFLNKMKVDPISTLLAVGVTVDALPEQVLDNIVGGISSGTAEEAGGEATGEVLIEVAAVALGV